MPGALSRRDFVQLSLAGGGLYLGGGLATARAATGSASTTGRSTQARIARLYLGTPGGHWPTPKLDLHAEIRRYEEAFTKFGKEFADVTFSPDALVTSVDEVRKLRERPGGSRRHPGHPPEHRHHACARRDPGGRQADDVLRRPLFGARMGRPGRTGAQARGCQAELHAHQRPEPARHRRFARCGRFITSRPRRSSTSRPARSPTMRRRFKASSAPTIVPVTLERVLDLYHGVDDGQAAAEAELWIKGATEVKRAAAQRDRQLLPPGARVREAHGRGEGHGAGRSTATARCTSRSARLTPSPAWA